MPAPIDPWQLHPWANAWTAWALVNRSPATNSIGTIDLKSGPPRGRPPPGCPSRFARPGSTAMSLDPVVVSRDGGRAVVQRPPPRPSVFEVDPQDVEPLPAIGRFHE